MATDPRIEELSPQQLGKLAQRLMRRRNKTAATITPLSPEQRSAGVTLSPAQQRLWFLQRLYPEARCYHAPIALRLRGTLAYDALEAALDQLVRRHEILRTRFVQRDGEPLQQVLPHRPVTLDCIEVGAARYRQLLLAELQRPFDLAAAPAWRAKLWRLGDNDHVLLLMMHHIVCDGWSVGIMMGELADAYRMQRSGTGTPPPPLPIQYGDFADWQNKRLREPSLSAPLEQYWRDALQDIPAHTPLPLVHEAPADPSFQGAFEEAHWPQALLQRCRRYASEHGATLYMVLMAAFASLLHRYGSRSDVVIGSPLGNRFPRETEQLIGLFLETVPLRVDLSNSPSFTTVLERVKDVALQAERHRHLPFDRIVKTLGLSNDRRHHPIFQAMLVLENAFDTELRLDDTLTGELITDIDLQAAAFAWTLVALEQHDGLWLKLEYQHPAFDAATARRALQHLRTLMQQALAAPEAPIATLPMLGDQEQLALARFNATATDYPTSLCVHQQFEQIARRYPDHLAVEHPDGSLTYAQLNAQASKLARQLRRHGVVPDQVVAMCLPRTPLLLVAWLAILKAGGAWLVLGEAEPRARLDAMLDECRVKLLLTHRSVTCAASETVKRLWLDAPLAEEPADTAGAQPPQAAPTPSHLAYVIFTSGTTARPKGVLLEHGGLLNMALSQIAAWGVTPQSRILQFFSPTFDGAVSEIVMALLSGATLVMARHEQLQPGRPLHETLRNARISMTCLPPSVLAVLPDEPLPQLRVLLSGGEACTADLVARWQPDRRFFNAYGPTEVTIGSSTSECFAGTGEPTIGTPFANRQMYVLDDALQVLPAGVTGEIYIGGAGIARGYLNRPEQTAERFIADPFNAGGRLYRTGDMGRFVERDGALAIAFAGRRDSQVKLRGFRIELQAVEAAISGDASVRDAVVLAHAGQLAAFVVPARSEVDIESLQLRLRDKLPEHMQPHSWTVLAALPLTTNGKVDRRQLLEQRRQVRQAERVPPRDALQSTLVELWAALLERNDVGIRDDFFALGGHSLLVAKLMARIEQTLGMRLPLAVMFRARTVERLAEELRAGTAEGGEEMIVPLEPGAGQPLYLIHPVGGNALCYVALAAAIRKASAGAIAVYGVQAIAGEPYPATLQSLASRYVAAIDAHRREREQHDSATYRTALGGWSFGGVVAFEIARQMGGVLSPVTIIDAALHDTWGIAQDADDELLKAYFRLDLLGLTSGAQLDTVRALRSLPQPQRIEQLRALTAAAKTDDTPPIAQHRLQPLQQMFCAHARAFLRHEARAADVDVTLFCARSGDQRDAGPWRALVGGALQVHSLPGDHLAMLQAPATETIAARLVEQLSPTGQGDRQA